MEASGRIVTFYSYKGGTGRSMMLANFAWMLAANGKKVLAIDWDLEAPGLHRYFRPFLADPDLAQTDGLIDAFWKITSSAMTEASSTTAVKTRGPKADAPSLIADVTRRLTWSFPPDAYIDFVGAGRQNATYSERVNSFDWRRFYELGGAVKLSAIKSSLRKKYDWVLIDSRTGVSDTSGICTMHMPESIVACFTLNRQSVNGVSSVLQAIHSYQSSATDRTSITFFPLATRIENAEQDRLEAGRGYARDAMNEFLPESKREHPREYWDKMEIAYRPAYAFGETLAAFGDSTGATGASDTMLAQVEKVAQLVADNADLRMPEIIEQDRQRILAIYALGTLPDGAEKKTVDDDSTDTRFLRDIRSKEQLWRTKNFDWRYLLSLRELDLLTAEDLKGFGRSMSFYHLQSQRIYRLFRTSAWGATVSSIAGIVTGGAIYLYLTYGGLVLMLDRRVVTAAQVGAWVIGLGLFLTTALVFSRDTPRGLRRSQIVRFALAGGLHAPIRDYAAAENVTANAEIPVRSV